MTHLAAFMRDAAAALVAFLLLFVALSLATALRVHRAARRRAERAERGRGRTVVAEVPGASGLSFFSEDAGAFHYGAETIAKTRIHAARMLINGAAIATCESSRSPRTAAAAAPVAFDDPTDGIARDRWDVTIEHDAGLLLVECGAIRERVSQELARKVFDAVKRALEELEAQPRNGRRE